MNKTWLLFDNGSNYSVTCFIQPAASSSKKLGDAYVVASKSDDFTYAAETAAHATYECLADRKQTIDPFIACLKLMEQTGDSAHISGASCGLIFCIVIAQKLMKTDLPDIAATGVISMDGSVEAVSGLRKKIAAAAELLEDGGYIFYPKANNDPVPREITEALSQKKIRIHGVSHITDVFDILFEPERAAAAVPLEIHAGKMEVETTFPAKPGRPLLPILIIILCVCLAGAGVYYAYHLKPVPKPPVIENQDKDTIHDSDDKNGNNTGNESDKTPDITKPKDTGKSNTASQTKPKEGADDSGKKKETRETSDQNSGETTSGEKQDTGKNTTTDKPKDTASDKPADTDPQDTGKNDTPKPPPQDDRGFDDTDRSEDNKKDSMFE